MTLRPSLTPFLVCALFCAQISISAADDLLVRLEIFSVSKVAAMRMLNDARMVTEPAVVMDLLRKLESSREVQTVASPSLTTAWATNTRLDGKVRVELDAKRPLDGITDILIVVSTGKLDAPSAITTQVPVRLGNFKFLGTLEPPDAANRDRTWLVFIHAR